jgi:beta-phosphoglucomutase family hydrolase
MSAVLAGVSLAFDAAIFDMDGVLTRTARLHAAAWKALFDDLLRRREGEGFRPFDEQADYRAYVDGKPRREGVRSFLRARGIDLDGAAQQALAQRKDALFERALHAQGVETFASSLALVRALRERGVKTAVVTSSRHGREVLAAAGIDALFDARLDGIDLDERGLAGKPDPDMFVAAVEALQSTPARALVFEDAVAGVQAGRRGGFGLVVGVDRGDNAQALAQGGADLVIGDLGELDVQRLDDAFHARQETMAWEVEEEGYDPARERQMETLFAVGNGYLGVRGALDVPPPGSQCDLFVAGIYDRKRPDLPYSEIEFLAPERGEDPYAELVSLPFPFVLAAAVDGEALDFAGPHGIELRRTLDLKRGVLEIDALYETGAGRRTRVRTRRCASLADPHLLLQDALATAENHFAEVTLSASLEQPALAQRHPHLERVEHAHDGDVEIARYATRASGFEICLASRVWREGEAMRRLVSVFTSRDGPDPRAAALGHVRARAQRFDALMAAHEAAWAAFWQRADIRVPGRPSVEQALRFGSYHLRLPAGDDPRVSIGARALTGRAYEGHVFWDVEIFMLPFHLHTDPARARTLLLFRHATLEGARRRARELGQRGACFAWESNIAGDDVTPTKIVLKSSGKEIPIFTGRQQIHVTADVAYAVWRYWDATQDEDFLAGPGAQILFETARFWAGRTVPDGPRRRIRDVVGPDEYHHGVTDNAYTNWMARFNLERAAWAAQRLNVHAAEAQEWQGVAAALHCPQPGADGVIEQFEGFFELADHPLSRQERFKAPVARLFDWERVNRMKVIKQADVLMLPMLFPDEFSDAVVAANYRYYEPLTDHGSSLSPAVHAAIAARLGFEDDAQRYWKESLWLDLSNKMDNSTLGIHAAAMGGTWQALVFGWLGVRFGDGGPRIDPLAAQRLPPSWRRVALTLAWRGRSYPLEVTRP